MLPPFRQLLRTMNRLEFPVMFLISFVNIILLSMRAFKKESRQSEQIMINESNAIKQWLYMYLQSVYQIFVTFSRSCWTSWRMSCCCWTRWAGRRTSPWRTSPWRTSPWRRTATWAPYRWYFRIYKLINGKIKQWEFTVNFHALKKGLPLQFNFKILLKSSKIT